MAPTPAPPRVHFRTLGCRLNQAESDEIRTALAARGIETAGSAPQVVVVNTCTVTSEASKASRKLIRRTIGDYPTARILVTGCYAVAEPDAVAAIPGVAGVVANKDKDQLADRIAAGFADSARVPVGLRHKGPRVNFKIQTGCDEQCAFCIVPQTRGGLASRPPGEVMEAARALTSSGVRELVLTGVHLGKYGWERGSTGALPALIAGLGALPDLERIRLSSIEASQVDEDFLRMVADEPKLCRHLHIPLQTGDQGVWRAMARPGTLERYLRITERAKQLIPDVTISTDVMVGFPGEDESAFTNTLRVIEEVGFRKLHVFRYSARPGTPAAGRSDQIDEQVKRRRSDEVRVVGDRLRRAWLQTQLGSTVEVLVEQAGASRAGNGRPALSGLTDHYLRVRTSGPAGLVGRLVDVLVASVGRDAVEGEIVGGLSVLRDRRGFDSV